jgi:hypothetical protein
MVDSSWLVVHRSMYKNQNEFIEFAEGYKVFGYEIEP